MAVFSVLNGAGLAGGIRFGALHQIASSGVSGLPVVTSTSGVVLFNDTGGLTFTGTGMTFVPLPPPTIAGTVTSLTYGKPLLTGIFSITGMSAPLTAVAATFWTGGDELAGLAIIFSGDDTIGGSTQGDLLIGFDGADIIAGGDGNDTLRGGAGGDSLDGGAGSDFANYQGSSAGVSIDLQTNGFFGGDANGDVLTNIENLYGSNHDDNLAGNAVRNIIGGEAGDDLLQGRAGDDSLSGEVGGDFLDGGDGNDRLVGGAGVDTLHGEGDNDSIDAGADNDQVHGDAGNDVLYGGAGIDNLEGGDGNDVLEGGADADFLQGGAGVDTASYASSAAGVTVVLGSVSSGGDAAGDTSNSVEQVIGSGFGDSITGTASANTLWGMAGNDVLTGGAGADVLKGGAGNDSFAYLELGDSTVAAAGKDVIVDFTTGDKIDLSAIDANAGGPGDTAFTGAGQIRVLAFANNRYGVYLEATGDQTPESIINVYSDHSLTAADFVL